MRTNTRPIYVIVFLLATGVLIWVATLVPSRQKPDSFPPTLGGQAQPQAKTNWPTQQQAQDDAGFPRDSESSTIIHDRSEAPVGEYFRYLRQAYSHRIEFYGKIIDQDGNPVPGADIDLGWAKPPPHEYGNKVTMQSDADGRFELKDVVGRILTVKVAKSGYYFPNNQRMGFNYAPEEENFKPDPNNPIIFRLRKRGPGVELVTSHYGANSHLGVSAPKDGTPVWVDFFERKVSDSGQMQISKLTPPRSPDGVPKVQEWRLTLSIPDGGFIKIEEQEFLFYPPESGYQPVLDFHYPPDREGGWTDRVKGEYYIAFGNPRRYGRIEVSATATGGVRLEYVVNPDGRPYLEPKEVVIE